MLLLPMLGVLPRRCCRAQRAGFVYETFPVCYTDSPGPDSQRENEAEAVYSALNISHLTWKKKFAEYQIKIHLFTILILFLFFVFLPFFFLKVWFQMQSKKKKEKKIQQESSPLMELLSASHPPSVLPTCFK